MPVNAGFLRAAARATSVCWLALYRRDDTYRLEVKDDGRGGAITEGLGARSIRTRVEALGGQVAWYGDAGMRLVIDIPLAESPPR